MEDIKTLVKNYKNFCENSAVDRDRDTDSPEFLNIVKNLIQDLGKDSKMRLNYKIKFFKQLELQDKTLQLFNNNLCKKNALENSKGVFFSKLNFEDTGECFGQLDNFGDFQEVSKFNNYIHINLVDTYYLQFDNNDNKSLFCVDQKIQDTNISRLKILEKRWKGTNLEDSRLEIHNSFYYRSDNKIRQVVNYIFKENERIGYDSSCTKFLNDVNNKNTKMQEYILKAILNIIEKICIDEKMMIMTILPDDFLCIHNKDTGNVNVKLKHIDFNNIIYCDKGEHNNCEIMGLVFFKLSCIRLINYIKRSGDIVKNEYFASIILRKMTNVLDKTQFANNEDINIGDMISLLINMTYQNDQAMLDKVNGMIYLSDLNLKKSSFGAKRKRKKEKSPKPLKVQKFIEEVINSTIQENKVKKKAKKIVMADLRNAVINIDDQTKRIRKEYKSSERSFSKDELTRITTKMIEKNPKLESIRKELDPDREKRLGTNEILIYEGFFEKKRLKIREEKINEMLERRMLSEMLTRSESERPITYLSKIPNREKYEELLKKIQSEESELKKKRIYSNVKYKQNKTLRDYKTLGYTDEFINKIIEYHNKGIYLGNINKHVDNIVRLLKKADQKNDLEEIKKINELNSSKAEEINQWHLSLHNYTNKVEKGLIKLSEVPVRMRNNVKKMQQILNDIEKITGERQHSGFGDRGAYFYTQLTADDISTSATAAGFATGFALGDDEYTEMEVDESLSLVGNINQMLDVSHLDNVMNQLNSLDDHVDMLDNIMDELRNGFGKRGKIKDNRLNLLGFFIKKDELNKNYFIRDSQSFKILKEIIDNSFKSDLSLDPNSLPLIGFLTDQQNLKVKLSDLNSFFSKILKNNLKTYEKDDQSIKRLIKNIWAVHAAQFVQINNYSNHIYKEHDPYIPNTDTLYIYNTITLLFMSILSFVQTLKKYSKNKYEATNTAYSLFMAPGGVIDTFL